jgi:DNA mismatch repair protein MutS2
VNVTPTTLQKLDFPRIQAALAERAASFLGVEKALAVSPELSRFEAERAWARTAEALSGSDLSLGGVHDIRPLLERVRDGRVLEGLELLEIAYTMDASGTIKRSILASENNSTRTGECATTLRPSCVRFAAA